MKKTVIAVLAFGLVAGSLVGPATAKKKKPRKPPVTAGPVAVDQTFFLRNVVGECDDANYVLLAADGPDEVECGTHFAGGPGVVSSTAADSACDPTGNFGCNFLTFNAGENVPFVLDATKDVKGLFGIGSWVSGPEGTGNGIGAAEITVTLTGTSAGETKTIGTQEFAYNVTPNQGIYEHELSIKPDAALDKAEFTSLELTITFGGAAAEHGWPTLETPASNFTIGTWKTA